MAILSSIYDRLPLALRSGAVSAYGAYLAWLRYGGNYSQALEWLQGTERLDAARLREIQNAELRRLLATACAQSPYYRELGLDASRIDLDSLGTLVPILTKPLFRQHQREIEIELPGHRSTTRINTSGTTGTPINVLASRAAIRRNYAFFTRFLSWGGVRVRDRSATFSGRTLIRNDQTRPPYWLYNAATNTMHYSSYHVSVETAEAYLASLERLRPLYIDSYPSAIYTLAKVQSELDGRFAIRPKAIFTSSETLLEHQRAVIEAAFGCRVFDQFGNAEMAGFISQCERGTYHSHPEYGIVEIVDADGKPTRPGENGRLILTGFTNPVTPLIRYEIGDTAAAWPSVCACGREFPAVGAIVGRMDDVIHTPEGRQIGRLDPVFKGVTGLLESQILQDRPDRVRVLLVASSPAGIPEASAAQLTLGLRQRLGPTIRIDLETVSHIPRTHAGKFRAVVSHLK